MDDDTRNREGGDVVGYTPPVDWRGSMRAGRAASRAVEAARQAANPPVSIHVEGRTPETPLGLIMDPPQPT